MLRWAGQSSVGWVLAGQVDLQLDSGDIVVQRGKNHSWINGSSRQWARVANRYSGRRDVYLNVVALDDDLERAQYLLASNHIEQLNAWREVCPLDNLPGTDVEARPVKRTLHNTIRDDLAAGKRREHVSAIRLGGEEAVGQMVEDDLLCAHREGLHLTDAKLI